MAIKVGIYDGAIPVIDFIAQRSFNLARESLSVTGAKLQNQMRKDITTYHHNWFHGEGKKIPISIVGHKSEVDYILKRNRYIWKDVARTRTLGDITHHDGSRSYPNMVKNIAQMITFYVPTSDSKSTNMLQMTVGGANKAFRPEEIIDGKVTGRRFKEVGRKDKRTRSIFEKLNSGKVDRFHDYYRHAKGLESDHHHFVARPFMSKAIGRAKPEIMKSLQKRYNSVLPKVVNNVKLNIRKAV